MKQIDQCIKNQITFLFPFIVLLVPTLGVLEVFCVHILLAIPTEAKEDATPRGNNTLCDVVISHVTTSRSVSDLITKTDIYQFESNQCRQKEIGVRYIEMAINGLAS